MVFWPLQNGGACGIPTSHSDEARSRPRACPRPPCHRSSRQGWRDLLRSRLNYDPDADRIGVQAAESLGVSPGLVLKTLLALVDGKPVCVIVPSDREVSMKRLAATCGGGRLR